MRSARFIVASSLYYGKRRAVLEADYSRLLTGMDEKASLEIVTDATEFCGSLDGHRISKKCSFLH
jgi:hypothetical protein